MKTYIDKNNKFIEQFCIETGLYIRSGVIENGKDTGIDPFMRNFPQLIDIGIMGHCRHGSSGACLASGIRCYQSGNRVTMPNMMPDDFHCIVLQCRDRVFQMALGGRGDVDQHEHFEELLSLCRENDIVPNFTTSGFGLTLDHAKVCKKYTGAVAVSWYRTDYTHRAVNYLLDAGVKTNIHYVLDSNSIDEAIERLKNWDFPVGINAVIFLLYKPIGIGNDEIVLWADNDRVAEFFKLVDTEQFPFIIGIVNHSELGRLLGLEYADDAWEIKVTDEKVSAFTIMNNFDMGDFLDKIGVDRRVVEWDEYERSYTSYITAETSATWKQLLLTIYST